MVRAIDADALKKALSEAIKDAPLYIQATVEQYIDEAPTLTPPNEWVSVEGRLPNPKQNVLAYSPKSGIAEADYADGVWMQYRWSAVMDGVTYWMPLPAPPAKEDQK